MPYFKTNAINQIKPKKNKVVLKEMMKKTRKSAGIFLDCFQEEDDSTLGNTVEVRKEILKELYSHLNSSFIDLKKIDFSDDWTSSKKYKTDDINPFFDENNVSEDNYYFISNTLFSSLIDIEVLCFLYLNNNKEFKNKNELYKHWLSFNEELQNELSNSENIDFWIKIERRISEIEKNNKHYSVLKKAILKEINFFIKYFKKENIDLNLFKKRAFKAINVLSIISYYLCNLGDTVELTDKIK